ncbi:hypothetical protein HMPREF1981_01309 [Bacteroides pyogenes F0041]|uniref:Uncharacterized protein n=1 Tax=Bacteroides pyogenes F0041 TaxID=1321819 RepID=U2E0T1_9BACE|nr:hypothetical protein HMPREF1981_01309 [Bacteroides pyogenes F0041]
MSASRLRERKGGLTKTKKTPKEPIYGLKQTFLCFRKVLSDTNNFITLQVSLHTDIGSHYISFITLQGLQRP